MKSEALWIVGKFIAGTEKGSVWEIQGIFETEQMAINHCPSPNFFIGPLGLNEMLPEETVKWEGAYYPIIEGCQCKDEMGRSLNQCDECPR